MLRKIALTTLVALPLLGACSSMMGDNGSGPAGSASTVSRDSQGAGATAGPTREQGDTTAK